MGLVQYTFSIATLNLFWPLSILTKRVDTKQFQGPNNVVSVSHLMQACY